MEDAKHVRKKIDAAERKVREHIYRERPCKNCGAIIDHSNFCDPCCAAEYHDSI